MNKFSQIELDEKKLAEETLQYILKIQNTYLESTLYIDILDPREKYGDLHQHIDFLKERLSHLEFFVDYTDVSFKNSMFRYTHFIYDTDGSTVDNSQILTKKRDEIEGLSKEILWANPQEEEKYQSISNFNSFVDVIVPKEKRLYKLIYSPFFNIEGWIKYYQDLLDIKFPEFSEKLIFGKTILNYTHFKEDYYIGIESNYDSTKKEMKKGYWETPVYQFIIFKKLSAKKIEKVVIFKEFSHPFFSKPALSFRGFFATRTIHQISELHHKIDNYTREEYLEDGTIRFYNSEDFGGVLKRHAYFYYDMLYHTTKEYIKYIKESFSESM